MILLTGAAGFIGHVTAKKLTDSGYQVTGIDNLNDYYEVKIKEKRVAELKNLKGFRFLKLDIENQAGLEKIFKKCSFSAVINLAARAGVRYSMENPHVYMSTNAQGTLNLLEMCRKYDVKKFVLASTSSLYAGQKMPFKESLAVNTPISPYAASKKAAEAMCYSYHYLYGIDTTILRYFTVYGPSGRPDMSIFRFIWWNMKKMPLEVFGDGTQLRDFTFVDDIASGTVKALKNVRFQVINLGNSNPQELNYLISLIEKETGIRSVRNVKPFHIADLNATWADTKKAERLLKWTAEIPLEEGVKRTVSWMKDNWSWVSNLSL